MVLRNIHRLSIVLAWSCLALLIVPREGSPAESTRSNVLRIGSSPSLTEGKNGVKEKSNLATLSVFIKDETGMDNTIVQQKGWREMADRMVKGELELGVFQGYEFAWAQELHADLKPLALAVNVHRYPVVCVMTHRDDKASDFAGLQGGTIAIPAIGEGRLKLYVERQCRAARKKPDEFFTKVNDSHKNVEDPLDDVVDRQVKATVVNRAALEAFKKRKPIRFKQLKQIAESQPFPPGIVAYYGKNPDEATRKRLLDGLLGAARKEKGQMMLTLFRLTGFETVPDDLGKVLTQTRKDYPPPDARTK